MRRAAGSSNPCSVEDFVFSNPGFFEPLLYANLFMLYKTMIQLGGTACIKMN